MRYHLSNSPGKTSAAVIMLLIGLLLGAIVGGELIRRMYGISLSGLWENRPERFVPATTAADSAEVLKRENRRNNSVLNGERHNAVVQAVERVRSSVVGVVVVQNQVRNTVYMDDFFGLFFMPQLSPEIQQVEKIGSGFVISKEGLILTNYHVVEGAVQLYVNFPDRNKLNGKIVGIDPGTDLAIISVKGDSEFAPMALGNSDDLLIGEWAIAIGNPFLNFINDPHPTVTVGVISAMNRDFVPREGVYYQGMIQTDAAINPGNSGGPLINSNGQVIGINSFIVTGSKSSQGSVGIGFAIPINRAKKVVKEMLRYGTRRKIYTGISVQNLTREIAQSLGYKETGGVVIVDIARNSPGEAAGLKPGDLIIAMGNKYIQSSADIGGFFLDYFVGDTVTLEYFRDHKRFKTTLALKEGPKIP